MPGCGKGKKLKVSKINDIIVIILKKIVLDKLSNVDEIIAGTIKKITKGFVIPPVKKIKTDNCMTS